MDRPGPGGRPRPGAGADQLLARGQRLVEPVGVRQRHGDAGGEGGLGRIGAHAVAELRQRFRPAAQVAQRARHRQPNVGGRLRAGGQLRVGLRHLVGPARPAGHQDAVLDGARAAGRTQGAQHGQRRLVVAGARAQDQGVVVVAGLGGRGTEQGSQGGADGREAVAQAGGGRRRLPVACWPCGALVQRRRQVSSFSFFSYIRNTSAVATYGVHVRASQRRPAAGRQRAAQACASGMAESARARAASAGVGSEQWIS